MRSNSGMSRIGAHSFQSNRSPTGNATSGGGGAQVGEDRNALSLLAWNRPYVVMLPSSGLETEPVQRLLVHSYADE